MNRREIDIIENAVTIPSVLASHRVTSHGQRCKCPIHNGNRYSFSFTDKLFHCFTCGASGGVIQLEAGIDGISDDDAVRRLANEYALDIDRPLTTEERRGYELERKVADDYKEWKHEQNDYYMRLSNLYRNIKDVPELNELAQDLEAWLDDNIEGVIQPWRYLNTQ